MTKLFADRAMILFMWLLVAAPAISIVVSPNDWRYANALENQKAGNLDAAEKQFKELTNSEPNNVAAWYRLSEIALERKEYSEASQHIDRAMTASGRFVDPRLGDQKATILLAMGKGRQAISEVKQFAPLQRGDPELSSIPQEVLNDLLGETKFQVYFNKLAYWSAVGGVELINAARFIDAVLLHFHQEQDESQLALAYLHELSGEYEKAQKAYADILSQTENELPPLTGLSSFLTNECGIEESKVNTRSEIPVDMFVDRHKVLHRMKMIAERLSQTENAKQIEKLIQNLPEKEKLESSLKFIVNSEKILDQASSLRSYLDTRAFVNFRRAEKLEMQLSDSNDQFDVTSFAKAKVLYEKSLTDMERAIELQNAIERLNEVQPPNSLLVRRATDEYVAAKQYQKGIAVLYFHYALILESNGRFSDAALARQKVSGLGFEIDELLF